MPLVVQEYLDQEERVDNLEKKATRDHRVYQGLQDQGDQLDLLGYLDRKANQVCMVHLAILVTESQESLVKLVLKVNPVQVARLDFPGHQDNLDPLVLQDYLLHLLTLDRSFPYPAHTIAKNKCTKRMEGTLVEMARRCLRSRLSSQIHSLLLVPLSSLTNSFTMAIRTTIPKLAFSPVAYQGSTTLLTTSTAKEVMCGWH